MWSPTSRRQHSRAQATSRWTDIRSGPAPADPARDPAVDALDAVAQCSLGQPHCERQPVEGLRGDRRRAEPRGHRGQGVTGPVVRCPVLFSGRLIADTTRALTLKEVGLPLVQYIPRDDADMSLLERTAHKTHCGYKGDAGYYTIRVEGHAAENGVWTYEDPYPAVAAIKGHLAFYPDRVDRIEELSA